MFENDTIPARVLNSKFIDEFLYGNREKLAASVTDYTRTKIRERSFLPKIATEFPIQGDQLTKDEDLDVLKKIVEIEPDSTATWLSFRSAPESRYLRNKSAVIYFGEIASDKITKKIIELKTRDNDIRKIVSDNIIKDVDEAQDGEFMRINRKIIVDHPDQQYDFNGGLSHTNFVESLKILPGKRMATGVALMNEATSKDILKWDTNDIGFEPVTEHYRKGLTEPVMSGGIKYITTIKNDMVLDGEVWLFPPEEFFIKFYTLQDTTVFMKAEGDSFEMFAYKWLGIGITRTEGVIKCVYNP